MASCKAPRGNLDDSCMNLQSCMRRHTNNELCETGVSDKWDNENFNDGGGIMRGILLNLDVFS